MALACQDRLRRLQEENVVLGREAKELQGRLSREEARRQAVEEESRRRIGSDDMISYISLSYIYIYPMCPVCPRV